MVFGQGLFQAVIFVEPCNKSLIFHIIFILQVFTPFLSKVGNFGQKRPYIKLTLDVVKLRQIFKSIIEREDFI